MAAIAKIANDVAKTKRLCDIMFNPGRRRTQTKPGKLRHHASEIIAMMIQSILADHRERRHQAKGASTKAASRPAYPPAALSGTLPDPAYDPRYQLPCSVLP